MNRKRRTKKWIAILCTVAMLCSFMPAAVWAEEGVADVDISYEEPSYDYYEEPSYDYYEEPSYDYYEEPVYEEPVYEEPVYEESVYEEPAYEEPVTVEEAAASGDLDALAHAAVAAVEEQNTQPEVPEPAVEALPEEEEKPVAVDEDIDEYEEYFDVEAAYWYYMSLPTEAEKEAYLRSLSDVNRWLLLQYIREKELEAYYAEQESYYEEPSYESTEQYADLDQAAANEKIMEDAAASGNIDKVAEALANAVQHAQEKAEQFAEQKAAEAEANVEDEITDVSFPEEIPVEEISEAAASEGRPLSSAEKQYNAFMALETEEEKEAEYDAMSEWEQKKLDNIIKLKEIDDAILLASAAEPAGEPETVEASEAETPAEETEQLVEGEPAEQTEEPEAADEPADTEPEIVEAAEPVEEPVSEEASESEEAEPEEEPVTDEEPKPEEEEATEESDETSEEEIGKETEEESEEEEKSEDEEKTEDEAEEKEYLVRFFDFDEVQIGEDQLVKEGEAATAPEAPEKEGVVFAGWSADFTAVTSDLDIYPIAEEAEQQDEAEAKEYLVRFFDFDEVQIGEDQFVKEGEAATAPEAPEKEGYVFTGWSEDFTAVTADLDVHPLYEEEPEKTPISAFIWHESADGSEITYGSEVVFYASIDGADEAAAASCQWQMSYDGSSWFDVPGATGLSHTITVDESNAQSYWRLVVNG